VTNFIFGARENSAGHLKNWGANPNISPISPFLKPPLIAMLIKEPEMLLTDAFCEHTMHQHATVVGTKAPAPDGGRAYSLRAYNVSQILAGLRGSLRGVHGRRQGQGRINHLVGPTLQNAGAHWKARRRRGRERRVVPFPTN